MSNVSFWRIGDVDSGNYAVIVDEDGNFIECDHCPCESSSSSSSTDPCSTYYGKFANTITTTSYKWAVSGDTCSVSSTATGSRTLTLVPDSCICYDRDIDGTIVTIVQASYSCGCAGLPEGAALVFTPSYVAKSGEFYDWSHSSSDPSECGSYDIAIFPDCIAEQFVDLCDAYMFGIIPYKITAGGYSV